MAKDMDIIIQYLSEQCHVNVHTKNIIHIHSSSINHKNFNAENIVEYDNNKICEAKKENNSWIQLGFKEIMVVFDSYGLKTGDWNVNSVLIKNWILEISNDNKNDHEADQHENSDFHNNLFNHTRNQFVFYK